MKTATGSSASLASRAAAAVSAFLASAALKAACAAAAASRFPCASALAASSWVPRSAALAAAFCLNSSSRAFSSSFLGAARGAAIILSMLASSASARLLSAWSFCSAAGVTAAAARAAVVAADLASSAALAASAASAASLSARAGARHEQPRLGNRDGLGVIRRNDHAHADLGLAEQFLGKVIRHADAAVGGGVAGEGAAMQRDARPGDALHVRHPGIVIEVGMVVLVLLDD